MSTTQRMLYSTFAAKCRINPPDYAMSILVPVKYNKITVLLMQASIFNWTYLRCDWWFIDEWMRVILHICCQIQGTISGLGYVNYGPGQIKYIYISCYSGINIQFNMSSSILVIYRQFNARCTPHLLPNAGHKIRFTPCLFWTREIPIYLHFLLFRLQYSIERISAAIGDISTKKCVILHIYSQIQCTFAGMHHINPGHGQIQWNNSSL
jgi:hypothetical protein